RSFGKPELFAQDWPRSLEVRNPITRLNLVASDCLPLSSILLFRLLRKSAYSLAHGSETPGTEITSAARNLSLVRTEIATVAAMTALRSRIRPPVTIYQKNLFPLYILVGSRPEKSQQQSCGWTGAPGLQDLTNPTTRSYNDRKLS